MIHQTDNNPRPSDGLNPLGSIENVEGQNTEEETHINPEGHMSFAHNISNLSSPLTDKVSKGFVKMLQSVKGFIAQIFSSKSESAGKPLPERKIEALGKGSLIDRALKILSFNRQESSEVTESSEVNELADEVLVSPGESTSKPQVKLAPAKLENFTNEFKDENGEVVAKETAIRNATVDRKINGLESKLEQMKADLASLEGIDRSTLDKIGDYGMLQAVLEESKQIMKNAKEELPGWIQLRNDLRENIEEMQRNPGRVQAEFELYKSNIEKLQAYTDEQALTEAVDKLPVPEAGKVIPALIKLSDELKSEKQKELEQLLADPDTLLNSEKSSRAATLKKEIDQLGRYQFPPQELVRARVKTLNEAVEKTEVELATFKSEVEQTNATHGTTNTPRYRFQFIPHRELATKTKVELSNIAEKASITQLQSTLKDIGEIKGLTPPVLDESAAKDKQKVKAFREKVGEYLIAARDKVIPQYIEEFKVSKENGTPVLINSQLQTVGKPGEDPVSSIGRSGAISDFAHGEVSLQELKDYPNLQLLDKKGITENSAEAKKLISLYDLQTDGKLDRAKLSDLVLTIKAKAILSYGGESILQADKSKLGMRNRDALSMKNLWTGDSNLRLAMQRLVGKNKLSSISEEDRNTIRNALATVGIDMSKLHEINDKREQDLAGLVLQDLEMHFENQKVGGGNAIYARMGLLRLDKPAKNEYGSFFNERTQGLDTLAALNFLDGKKIVFDVKEGGGSFLHPDGTIHMPAKCKNGDLKETTLSTVFLNISVQGGNLKNSGLQKAVNEEGLKKLEKLGVPQAEIKEMKKMLSKISGLAGFSMIGDVNKAVCKIIHSMNTKRFYVSANCYGGKDRTGALLALLSKFALKRTAPKVFKKKEEDWKQQLTSNKGVMAQIAEANAGHRTVKAQARNTSLFGTIERIRHYFGGVMLAFRSVESKLEGQLFKIEGAKSYKLPNVSLLARAMTSARGALAVIKSMNKSPTSFKDFAN